MLRISSRKSVRTFWGGECADVLIENADGMGKLISVLTPLIKNDED